MSLLSICMPSRRDFEGSRRAIESALDYCKFRNAVLVVSDNSGDAEKQGYWHNRSPHLTYVISEAENGNANALNALNTATTPFSLMMGDDDELEFNPAIAPFDLSTLPDDHIGVRPLTHVWLTERGVFRVKDFAISGDDPNARMMEYNAASKGDNSAFYSIFRREQYIALMTLFANHHPTKGYYCDWALLMALFAYGKMAYDPGTIFRYNMDQWANAKMIEEKTASLFEAVGLPADTQKYHALLLFLDLFCFVSRQGTPLTREGALNALATTSGPVLNGFLNTVKAKPDDYNETIRYLCELAEQEENAMSRFQIALLMSEQIQPGLKDRYIAFYKIAIS